MHPATLHGGGVITELHFVIFVAFKESMTLNLAQESSKVIDFWYQSKARIYHSLRGSGSTVVTMTSKVNGKWKF